MKSRFLKDALLSLTAMSVAAQGVALADTIPAEVSAVETFIDGLGAEISLSFDISKLPTDRRIVAADIVDLLDRPIVFIGEEDLAVYARALSSGEVNTVDDFVEKVQKENPDSNLDKLLGEGADFEALKRNVNMLSFWASQRGTHHSIVERSGGRIDAIIVKDSWYESQDVFLQSWGSLSSDDVTAQINLDLMYNADIVHELEHVFNVNGVDFRNIDHVQAAEIDSDFTASKYLESADPTGQSGALYQGIRLMDTLKQNLNSIDPVFDHATMLALQDLADQSGNSISDIRDAYTDLFSLVQQELNYQAHEVSFVVKMDVIKDISVRDDVSHGVKKLAGMYVSAEQVFNSSAGDRSAGVISTIQLVAKLNASTP